MRQRLAPRPPAPAPPGPRQQPAWPSDRRARPEPAAVLGQGVALRAVLARVAALVAGQAVGPAIPAVGPAIPAVGPAVRPRAHRQRRLPPEQPAAASIARHPSPPPPVLASRCRPGEYPVPPSQQLRRYRRSTAAQVRLDGPRDLRQPRPSLGLAAQERMPPPNQVPPTLQPRPKSQRPDQPDRSSTPAGRCADRLEQGRHPRQRRAHVPAARRLHAPAAQRAGQCGAAARP